jgi:hypothetical protein
MSDAGQIEEALSIAFEYGGIDGAHHKTWVIDQMVRVLTGIGYPQFVEDFNNEDDCVFSNTYCWDEGIAP